MSDRDQAIGLLRVAARDLRALKGMVDEDTFADEVFGFVAQQAVEKSLKAWLCVLGQAYPFTHDITLLLSQLERCSQDVGELWNLAELNPFAVGLRYADLAEEDVPLDRASAIERVTGVVDRVKGIVGEDDMDHP